MSNPTRIPLRVARTAMAASANPVASLIGCEILRAGGNAMDAAVAMGAALSVMEPQHSQLGGDVCLQFWDAGARKHWALDGTGVAPAGATVEAMGGAVPRRGIRSASIPGAVDGWLTALARWGTLTASEALAPAIALAEDGYALPARQVALLEAHQELWNGYPLSGASLVPDHSQPGASLYQPLLAHTLRRIGDGGRAYFYEGEFADKLIASSEAGGGFITRDDLAGHQAIVGEPLRGAYRGVIAAVQPTPSQGHLLLQMLNIIEGYDLAALDPEGPDVVHVMAEAKKLAFADRAASPAQLSKDHAERQRRRIDLDRAATHVSPGRPRAGSETTSLCVVDARGNAVSLIQSLGDGYGSGVVVPETGVLLNNRMASFSLDPKQPNALAPGRRPPHTLNTWMLFQGETLWALGGTPGGDAQTQTDLQTITQLIDWKRDPQEAIESPKWCSSAQDAALNVEDRLPLETCYELRQRGHQLTIGGPWSAPCASQIILLDPQTGVLFGGSDPRADGLALGY